MEELSIVEKAKTYDELKVKAQQIHNKENDVLILHTIEDLFPELKESEDEMIRKAIATIVDYWEPTNYFFNNVSKEKCIAWLEKQRKQKPVDKIQLGKKYKCIASPRYSAFMTGKIYKPEDKFLCSLMNFCSDCFESIEDDEQKSVDKLEPKFKKGQWIVWQDKCYRVNYNGCGYELVDQNGLSTSLEYGTIDENAHLWDISNVKDGDVLIDNSHGREYPFIFKETKPSNIKTYALNPLTVLGYCGIGGAGFTKSCGWGDTANCTYYPATKEQRDTFFAKMKEAGYEWDSEKKELKITNWSKHIKYEPNSPSITKEKSAWSEEDKMQLDAAIDIVTNSGHTCTSDWLKDLKERYTWKPSDRQMKALKEACDEHWEPDGLDPLYTLWEQLKKLKG